MQNMTDINKLVRENVRHLQPYSCARDEYSGDQAVFLDANENPYDTGYNRYPDPHQRQLKASISKIKGVETTRMLLGNGSDEVIDLLIRCVCEPRRDNIIVFSPGYGMYEVSAAVNAVEVKKINLSPQFQPDWEEAVRLADENTKIVFLCTPNNPIGTVIPLASIGQWCERFDGLVVVDEAYIDFTQSPSAVGMIDKYPNLVVMQTLSKAWGMAGLRLGICFAHEELIKTLNKIKPPYNISSLTQEKALELLRDEKDYTQKVEEIRSERERLKNGLSGKGIFTNVYDSEANFLLVTSTDCRKLYNYLVENKVVVRLRDIPPLIQGGIRITVGTPSENDRVLQLLDEYEG